MNNNFFDKARTNMVNNQLLPNGVKNPDLIDSFDNTKKNYSFLMIRKILYTVILIY